MPAGLLHAVYGKEQFKMLLVVLKNIVITSKDGFNDCYDEISS